LRKISQVQKSQWLGLKITKNEVLEGFTYNILDQLFPPGFCSFLLFKYKHFVLQFPWGNPTALWVRNIIRAYACEMNSTINIFAPLFGFVNAFFYVAISCKSEKFQ